MITIFYIFTLILLLNEIFYIFNRKKLDVFIKGKNIETAKLIDIIPYFLKLCSFVWPLIGLFSTFKEYFLLLICFNLFRFLIYHINNKLYLIYIHIIPIINIIIYSIILYFEFLFT
jgi:hypothetical protein